MIDLKEPTPVLAPTKKPAKRWRNLWSVSQYVRFEDGTHWPPGEHWADNIYPSKELAENRAEIDLADDYRRAGFSPFTYLGAHPYGDDE